MKLLIAFLLIFVVGCCSIKNDEVNLSKKDINFHNEIIKNMENILYKINPKYNNLYTLDTTREYYNNSGEILYTFVILDITNSQKTRNYSGDSLKINFINGHVYHFSPYIPFYRRSGLVVVYNNTYKIFHSINCDEPNASSLIDVLVFIRDSVKSCDKYEIIKKVKNYRDFTDFMLEYRGEGFPKMNCD